jgi:hypothetical protein
MMAQAVAALNVVNLRPCHCQQTGESFTAFKSSEHFEMLRPQDGIW